MKKLITLFLIGLMVSASVYADVRCTTTSNGSTSTTICKEITIFSD